MRSSGSALRGVNLGGWLILEKWMTPALFAGTDATDEYTFMRTDGADRKIEAHRSTFIQESDFAWLAGNGIDAVRIPIGYWIFDGDDPYTAGIDYLDWAIHMATTYNLKVLIDLHGAKGSQNGKDHSGRIGKSNWYHRKDYRKQTVDMLVRLAERYRYDECVWGIELLNEPKIGLFHFKLRRFYNQVYDALLPVIRPGTYIIFHDAFTPRIMSGAILGNSLGPVAMDVHWYQFGSLFQKFQTLTGYFKKLDHRKKLVRQLQRRQPIVVGEWSAVLTGRVMRGVSFENEHEVFKKHATKQLAIYDDTLAWFYWTYKTEKRGIWHFRSQVEDGVISL